MPIRRLYKRIYKKNKRVANILLGLNILGLGILAAALGAMFLFIVYARDLPRPEKFTEAQVSQSTKIYDRTGKVVLYEIYGEEKRTLVPLSSIPKNMQQAVIATEDANFYNHMGIDPEGIARAFLNNLKIQGNTYGGSTLPQQLIRSAFFSNEKTIKRKVREIVLAVELDRQYSKDEILEWYLNQVPFGSNTYGVEAASQAYFQKPVSDISLAQSAVLTALIRAPSMLSPYGDYKEKLLTRKDYVLDRMAQEKYITQQEADAAKKEAIEFSDLQSIKAPHFVIHVIENYLKPKYGEDLSYLKRKGVKVYTSLDWDLQQAAEKAITTGVEKNRQFNANNAALVSLDPNTGEILAMVGSADWFADPLPIGCNSGKDCVFEPKYNVAVGTKNNPGRQPGSSFKPFVYAAAFKKGATDMTTVIDEPTNFGVWGGEVYAPQNYDGKFRGEITLRSALAQSLNVPAVKTLLYIAGLEDAVRTAQDLGISTLKPPYGPSIVLGGWEVKLLEMVSAYGVFAADGLKITPTVILKIEDNQGNILEQNAKTPRRVLESGIARMITDILSDNVARTPVFGARSHLYFANYKVSAKTGTTDDYRDAWTIGYTSQITTGVWAGNNNNAPLSKAQPAATVAGPIFNEFMQKALAKYGVQSVAEPIVTEPSN